MISGRGMAPNPSKMAVSSVVGDLFMVLLPYLDSNVKREEADIVCDVEVWFVVKNKIQKCLKNVNIRKRSYFEP